MIVLSISVCCKHKVSTNGANSALKPSVFSNTLYTRLGFSGDTKIIDSYTSPRDLQISFHVFLVAVAVSAIILTVISKYDRIFPRQENSFLNCFPLKYTSPAKACTYFYGACILYSIC